MRVPLPSSRPAALLAGALLATAGLTAAPTAGADVALIHATSEDAVISPVVVTPDGTRRNLALVLAAPDGAQPVVSPDRRFIVLSPASSDDAVLLPTDGSPTSRLRLFAVGAAGDGAFWWTGSDRVVAGSGGLGNRGFVDSCTVPGGPCRDASAPGTQRVGTFASGASLWVDQQDDELPEGLGGIIGGWETASSSQIRRIRSALRRRLRTRLVLRSPGGRDRVLRSTRRSSVAGIDTYVGLGDGAEQIVVRRSRERTTLRTRKRNGRTQATLDFASSADTTGRVTASGRSGSFALRTPTSSTGAEISALTAVPGGWLSAIGSAGSRGVPTIGLVGRGGTATPLQLGGRPLTARSLSAAVGFPIPATTKPRGGDLAFGLRPVGHEAATDSFVVAYDEPAQKREVVVRVPRGGGAPTLVQRGEPNVTYATVAW